MSRRTEVRVGITVLAALAILLWGVTWLKELSLARQVKVWKVRFEQTGGLGASDEVQVNGIRKGSVAAIHLAGDQVIVDLGLASDVTLTRDSRVAIRNVGLMGEKVIAVDLKATGAPYGANDTIPGIYEKGIPEVMAAMGDAVGTIQQLTNQLQTVADAMNKNGDFSAVMKNVKTTSEELKQAAIENRKALKLTVENFAAVSKTAKSLTADREGELRAALAHFESAAEKFDRMSNRIDSLRATIQNVSNKVDRGQGTLGKLVNDDQVYVETRAAVAELKALIADIKANPKKYLTVKIF